MIYFVINTELEIFNLGIALIESSENVVNNYAFRGNCQGAALISAIMSGVAGMISGSITGGLSGVIIGMGILSVPAGGAGAVIGAVFGGLSGFAGGYILGWLGCTIFGGVIK